ALSNEAPNKGHLQARIKQLETALAAIPEGDAKLATERASLATRLTDAKRQLPGSKPIGARIDGARAALGRARQRQAEAEQAVAAALQLQHTVACEVTALETELQELEASLTTEAPIEATATPESQAHAILGQMIDQLTADEYVHPGHVEVAKTHVRQLFAGCRGTPQQAEATRAAAAGTPLVPKEVRHTTKSPPAAPLPAKPGTLVRHSGKQPRKELITDYFSKRKLIKSIGKETAGLPATSKDSFVSGGTRATSTDSSIYDGLFDALKQLQVSCALLLGKVQILEQAFHDEYLDFVFIQGIPFILVSALAPSDRAPAAEREAFWDLLLQTLLTLRDRAPSAKTFLGIDANGRAGAGPTSRADYICGPFGELPHASVSHVPRHVQLSLIAKDDHRLVVAATSTRALASAPKPDAFRFNEWRLGDPARAQASQTMPRRLQAPVDASIDAKTQAMTSQMRTAARHAFGRPEGRPRQPWISDDTRSMLRLLAPSRRVVHAAGREAHRAYFHRIFLGWAAQRTGGTFGVARSLSGRAASLADHPVLLKSGELSSSEAERQAPRQEHYREVFNGAEAHMEQLRAQPVEAPRISPTVEVTPDAVAASLRQPGRNKGVGRDGAPAELLVAGGEGSATPLAALYRDIVDSERWSVHWAGGRMQNVRERKGPPTDCDESRGIVLEDHAAKSLKQLLSHMVTGPCQDTVPEVQHGAVAGRGADYAAQLAHSFQAYCNATGRSSFAWFVDLAKAFDRIVMEVVLGWPCDATDPEAYLASLGLSPDQSAWTAQWAARHGCLFAQRGGSPKVIRLLKNPTRPHGFLTVTSTPPSSHALAAAGVQVLIRDALLDAGILLRLRAGSPDFWGAGPAGPNADPEVVSLVDAAFVDVLAARLPKELGAAIDVALHTVRDIYDRLNLTIKWKVGFAVAVPRPVVPLLAVTTEKHLVGAVGAAGAAAPGANHLRQQAAMSYGPLASKVFGSAVVGASLKIWLMHSWVLSRLLFNVHVVVPTRRYLQVLNGMHMRVPRRFGDAPRFGRAETDLEIRTRLKQPSLDCLVMRARLRYLGRLVRSSPPALLALLAARPGGARLPWVTLLVSDLGKLRELVALCSTLPPPEGTASAWATFISDSPARWTNAVSMLFFHRLLL
ncbi:unnamed protein product, partial [Prorocentrum cordatum]